MRFLFASVICVLLAAVCGEEEDADIDNLKQQGAEYLQNVMNQLQNERHEGTPIEMSELTNMLTESMNEQHDDPKPHTITAPTPNPPLRATVHQQPVPPPVLTQAQLAAIYQAALVKGANTEQIQGNHVSQSGQPLHNPPKPDSPVSPGAQGSGGNVPGYYYYFYPIKSFTSVKPPRPSTTPAPMSAMNMLHMMETPDRGMEPLFMAISGFIGMALTFVFSVLFLPKFGKFRSGEDATSHLKEAPEDLATIGRIVIDTLDGKDCSERLACEIGRVFRKLKLGNKPLKVLEVLLPPNISRQIGLVRKAAARNEKCTFLECKIHTSRPPKQGGQKLTAQKPKKPGRKETPHDLWMKHFEKEKLSFKQPLNVWNRPNKD